VKRSKDRPDGMEILQSVNHGRRRITTGGFLAPVIAGSLLSRPVLGQAPYNCTISGQISGNTSSHGAPVNCRIGVSPGYWRQAQHEWPSDYVFGSGMITGNFKPAAIPTSDGSKQSSEGTLFTTPGFANVFKIVPKNGGGYRISTSSLGVGNATLLQIACYGGNDGGLVSLGRAAVASLLNAIHFAPNYPITAAQVVEMFNAVCLVGTYDINSSVSWNASEVKAYFESLY
jgi:hypothetical protein